MLFSSACYNRAGGIHKYKSNEEAISNLVVLLISPFFNSLTGISID